VIQLAANLSYLFEEVPFLDRFEHAAKAGFRGVEWNFAYEVPVDELRARLRDHDLTLVLVNTPAGNSAAGELGLAALPGRESDSRRAFQQALDYAVALEAPCIHFLAGKPPVGSDRGRIDDLFLENLTRAADLAAGARKILTLEPLNEVDRPGYHLASVEHAMGLIGRAGRPNVGLQLDLYHCEMLGMNSASVIERTFDRISHVQIAGFPGRREPDRGRLDYRAALQLLQARGYSGWVGCEYRPTQDTLAGLGWAKTYLSPHA
jgi:hydroxypyruvate isomerase